jgi:hypothetical protein
MVSKGQVGQKEIKCIFKFEKYFHMSQCYSGERSGPWASCLSYRKSKTYNTEFNNRNISGLSFGTFRNTTSKVMGPLVWRMNKVKLWKTCLRTEIVWVCFTIKIYQMPDSACAPPFVTMVTSPNIFEVAFPKVPKERPEMLRLLNLIQETICLDMSYIKINASLRYVW